MSPRKVLPKLRDFKGFSEYSRSPLPLSAFKAGGLDGDREQSEVWLHCCTKGRVFDAADPFKVEEEPEACACGKTRGEGGRKWRNHVKHCKG